MLLVTTGCTSTNNLPSEPLNQPNWIDIPQWQGYLVGLGKADLNTANYKRQAYLQAQADLNQQVSTRITSQCSSQTSRQISQFECEARLTSQVLAAKPVELANWQDANHYYLLIGRADEK